MSTKMIFKKFPECIPHVGKLFMFISNGELYFGKKLSKADDVELIFEVYTHYKRFNLIYSYSLSRLIELNDVNTPVIEQWFYFPMLDGELSVYSYNADKSELTNEPWIPSSTSYEWIRKVKENCWDEPTKTRIRMNEGLCKRVWSLFKSVFGITEPYQQGD